jgi:hypothetical protein
VLTNTATISLTDIFICVRKWYSYILPNFLEWKFSVRVLQLNSLVYCRKIFILYVFCKCCIVLHQNELIQDHAPVYLYGAIIWLKFTMSICLTAVNIIAVNMQVWGLDYGCFTVQLYHTKHIVQLWCTSQKSYKARDHGALHICEQPEIKRVVERRRQCSFLHGQFISGTMHSPSPAILPTLYTKKLE